MIGEWRRTCVGELPCASAILVAGILGHPRVRGGRIEESRRKKMAEKGGAGFPDV